MFHYEALETFARVPSHGLRVDMRGCSPCMGGFTCAGDKDQLIDFTIEIRSRNVKRCKFTHHFRSLTSLFHFACLHQS
jgi:hypothetical protein